MNVDILFAIDDYTESTLNDLIARISSSSTLEQLIYRECELDEVWRLLDGSVEIAKKEQPAAVTRLNNARTLIHDAHDEIGDNMDTHAAITCIQKAIAILHQ